MMMEVEGVELCRVVAGSELEVPCMAEVLESKFGYEKVKKHNCFVVTR